MKTAPYVLDSDQIYPRSEANRYRLYGRRGDSLDVLATCGSMEAVGVAIGQLHADAKEVGGVFGDSGQFGLLDALAGEWIVNPFSRPEPATRPGRVALRAEARAWAGKTVRARRSKTLRRVDSRPGPFGFPLEPIDAGPHARRVFRTGAELDRNWEIVS